jgi:hypothetical protein
MKTDILAIGVLLAVMVGGCSAPAYLPEAEFIDVNQYGSYIEITTVRGPNISGELIAVDDDSMIVLSESSANMRNAVSIAHPDIYGYKLRYAQPENHGWTIPLYSLFTISHGWYLAFTFPINLITTIAVTAGGSSSYTYSDRNISRLKLRQFARFPQGMPEGVDIRQLR